MILKHLINDEKLKIEYSYGSESLLWEKPLNKQKKNMEENTKICVDEEERNKIFIKHYENSQMFVVYSDNKYVYCTSGSPSYVYNKLLGIKSVAVRFGFSRNKFWMLWHGYYSNPLNLDIRNITLYIDEKNQKPLDIPIYRGHGKRQFFKNLRLIKFNLDDLLYEDAKFTKQIIISMDVDGVSVVKPIFLFHGNEEDTRYYYVPIKSKYYDKYETHIRRNLQGRICIIRRPKYEIENKISFRFFNLKNISRLTYLHGKLTKKLSHKKVGLFYEKFSEQAQEGTFEIFNRIRTESSLKAYFIIDKKSPDYQRIKGNKNIVLKYSMKYYWLLYRANIFISTESPAHLLFLRSKTIYFQKACLESPFIFLQHGITYLKHHGKTTPFKKGKYGFPTYIVVSSEKEKNIVAEMLGIEKNNIIKSGLPIFSTIDYMHINQESSNKAIIMLTWKPYEEFITKYEDTEYYKNTVKIASLLEKYIQHDDIIIVAHPKVRHLLADTHLKDRIWMNSVSDALKVGKLLITDYSSVCYNTFYQGGGVIFYHENLDQYESYVGKLIPSDDEYIGERIYSMQELEALLDNCIDKGEISLTKLRKDHFVQNYSLINEFSDGKNIDRLCTELKKLGLM